MDLLQRKKDLERFMLGLECSDDRLFTNANGNLPTYNSWKQELREIEKVLGEVK